LDAGIKEYTIEAWVCFRDSVILLVEDGKGKEGSLRFHKIGNSRQIRDIELERRDFFFSVLLNEWIEVLSSSSYCYHVGTILYHL
jgi:hypothetical protein